MEGSFGELVKYYRKRKKMTQRQVAAKLGVHYNSVWSWEQGIIFQKHGEWFSNLHDISA